MVRAACCVSYGILAPRNEDRLSSFAASIAIATRRRLVDCLFQQRIACPRWQEQSSETKNELVNTAGYELAIGGQNGTGCWKLWSHTLSEAL